ncbi:FtsX-like permease family protein [candidate division KSB1 bacterium]|nr:FtsX-like permease family protein [candidate division KSB1 bacterium]NIV68830.1 FtsX-like permease family protein [Phycisphaerae bacterium]NIW21814.1 FtsX-like permease family protein [candidate division KSB1 bacterium]
MSADSKGAKKIKLPIAEAFRLGLDNIRIRFSRSILTAAAIVLGIAFMTFLVMTTTIFRVYTEYAGVSAPIVGYQYWLVFISLLVCVVSITNSMLTAVYERYHEIGTMKCLGALDRHIILLFLIESALLGLLGGILGFICGGAVAVVTYGLQLGFDVVLHLSLYDVFVSFGLSVTLAVGLSVIATLYPAYRAAKAKPVEALRFEL